MRRGIAGLYRKRSVFWIGLMLLIAVPVGAGPLQQSSSMLAYGDTVEGFIEDDRPHETYTFEGEAGDMVIITMQRIDGDLDAYLRLLDPNGVLLEAADDRSDVDRNAELGPVRLSASGTYTIMAERYAAEKGDTSGAYALTLTLSDEEPLVGVAPDAQVDIGVAYQFIDYGDNFTAELTSGEEHYYLFAGESGDVVAAVVYPHEDDFLPVVRLYDLDLNQITESVEEPAENKVGTYYVVPEAQRYLLRVASQGEAGSYDLEMVGIAAQWIDYGTELSGVVATNDPVNWYVFNGRFGDTVTIFEEATSGNLVPYTLLADNQLFDLVNTPVGDNPAGVTYTLPRTDRYVLLVSRDGLRGGDTTGEFVMRLDGSALNLDEMDIPVLGYGHSLEGSISNDAPEQLFRFQGKAGDRVTIVMRAEHPNVLDTYLTLMDADLAEIAANDDAGGTTNARIFQVELPANGFYTILATRYESNTGEGNYEIFLQEGEFDLAAGAVEATLRWDHEADLDLAVLDPGGETVAAESPLVSSGGTLQIDTNADCRTVTALPVEHIYWPEDANLPGTYTFLIDYERDCENKGPVQFDLRIAVGGQVIERVSGELKYGERYEITVLVSDDGLAISNEDGHIITPEPLGGK